MKHCLYRHFDKKGRLLYVGVSLSVLHRSLWHRHKSNWYGRIATITVQWFKTRKAAIKAEGRAIRAEKPAHNIMGYRHSNAPTALGDYLTARRLGVREFAPICGLDAATVSRIAAGKQLATYDTSEKIRRASGNQVRDLHKGGAP